MFLSVCAFLGFYAANRKRLDETLALPRLAKHRPWNFDRFLNDIPCLGPLLVFSLVLATRESSYLFPL